MGKSTISMAIFNCYVSSPEGKGPKGVTLAEKSAKRTPPKSFGKGFLDLLGPSVGKMLHRVRNIKKPQTQTSCSEECLALHSNVTTEHHW